MHHQTGAREAFVVRKKMYTAIMIVHRGRITLFIVGLASFKPDKRHGRNHQDDERQDMSHSCQFEESHECVRTSECVRAG